MAVTLRKSHQYSKALNAHDRSVKIMSRILGKDHPETVYQQAQHAVTLVRSGDGKGLPMLQESLKQMENFGLKPDHIWMRIFRPELRYGL